MVQGQGVQLRRVRLDLHIHTVLSPCSEIDEMTPRAIVRAALDKGLDLIAICDHNSARNVAAAQRAALDKDLEVLAGMEVTSSEEAHILGLFGTHEQVMALQEEVYGRLPGVNDEEAFGIQVVVDHEDMVEDLDQRLLIGATTMSAKRIVDLIRNLGGISVASHIDRPSFSVFSQLGFIPPDLRFHAVEVSRRATVGEALRKYPQIADYPILRSSDAHRIEDVGSVFTEALMGPPCFDELRLTLSGEEGRGLLAEQ